MHHTHTHFLSSIHIPPRLSTTTIPHRLRSNRCTINRRHTKRSRLHWHLRTAIMRCSRISSRTAVVLRPSIGLNVGLLHNLLHLHHRLHIYLPLDLRHHLRLRCDLWLKRALLGLWRDRLHALHKGRNGRRHLIVVDPRELWEI